MATTWAFVATVIYILTIAKGQIINKTPHWERCSVILKLGMTANCTRYQTQQCHAQKARVANNVTSRVCSNGNECPPPISDLRVSVYKAYAEQMPSARPAYYGANVSWTVQKTGTDADFETKLFEARIEIPSSDRTFLAIVNVNLTHEDYINNKATIRYDCFYLLPEDSYMMAIVRTIPHQHNNFLSHRFNTHPSAVVTTQSHESDTKTFDSVDVTSETRPEPVNVNKTSSLTYGLAMGLGLFGGIAFILGLILCVFIARRFLPQCNKKTVEKDVENSQMTTDQSGDTNSLLLLYARDNNDHRSWCESLSHSLSRHCNVLDLWDYQRDNIYGPLQTATYIVLVMSNKLCNLLKSVTNSDDELIAVTFKILKQSKSIQEKVIVVCFENEKNLDVDLLPFNTAGPLALPDQESELLQILKRRKQVDKPVPMQEKHVLIKQLSDSEKCVSADSGYIRGPDTPSLVSDTNPFIPTEASLPGRAISCREVQYIPQQVWPAFNHGYHNPAYYHNSCPPCSPVHEHGGSPPHCASPHTDNTASLTTQSCLPNGRLPVYPRMYGSISDMESVLSSEVFDINRYDDTDLPSTKVISGRPHNRLSPIEALTDDDSEDISLTTTL